MKCSEWTVNIGFAKSHEPEKTRDFTVAQQALRDGLGTGDELIIEYSTQGRFINLNCKMSEATLDKTGGSTGHSHKLLKMSKALAKAIPGMTDLDVTGYYVNNHKTCQWRWIYDVKKDSGRLALIPVYLQNKMCCTDMTIEKFSVFLADWIDRMSGKVIGDIE